MYVMQLTLDRKLTTKKPCSLMNTHEMKPADDLESGNLRSAQGKWRQRVLY